MFGFRPDGRRLSHLDPIVQLTPYIMPQRSDAMVMTPQELDYDTMAQYIQKQRREGRIVSFMSIMIAAYVRVVSQYPETNRFISNKQIFARNEIAVCFNILKKNEGTDFEEAVVKLKFSPNATIFEVSEQIDRAIQENRKPEERNLTDKVAQWLLSTPGLPTVVVGLARVLDRYGLMPRIIQDASPFHTSMFLTNMASLGVNHVYHHIYNFGTTSVFISMGKIRRSPHVTANGTVEMRRVIPLGVVMDERICAGANYARAFALWHKLIGNPALMEVPPERVVSEMPGRMRGEEAGQAVEVNS